MNDAGLAAFVILVWVFVGWPVCALIVRTTRHMEE